MNWREKMIARLVLVVAVMLAEHETPADVRQELRELRAQVKQGGELELVFGVGPERLEVVKPGGEG